jgi:hypothetical protein
MVDFSFFSGIPELAAFVPASFSGRHTRGVVNQFRKSDKYNVSF